MSFIEQWRSQVNDSLVESARQVPFAPDVDLKIELMVVGILWPIRQDIKDFDVEAMSAVQEVVGENAKHVLRVVQQWGDDRLSTARSLAGQARQDNNLSAAFKTLITTFQAFPVFAKQLAAQARLASLPAQPSSSTPAAPAPPRVFIYYIAGDGNALAAEVRQKLEEAKIPVWPDLVPQEKERNWWQQVTQAVAQVEFLVLIMTPAAIESPLIRRYWRLARQQGVCIYPITAAADLDFNRLPRWIRQVHFYNLSLEWPKLINSLKGQCESPRFPFMVDDLPDDFVNRPAEVAHLLTHLFDPHRDEALVSTVALYGAGGYGKSSLAKALCHNEDIRQVFDNGILWVTLGEDPGDLSRHVIDLIEILSGERPGFTGLDAAAVRLSELWADRDLLLVIDDVWDSGHLKPFLQGGRRTARVITTRNISTLPSDSKIVEIGPMQPGEAVGLLGSHLPPGNQTELQHLADRLGQWPLLLRLTNGSLRNWVEKQQQTLPQALSHVNQSLDQHGLVAFDRQDAAARDQAVSQTVEASLELLAPADRLRFNELIIFPEEVDIPMATLEMLWGITGGLDDFDTEELCDRLHTLSLLSKFDLTGRQIRLHKVMRSYLIYRQTVNTAELHNQLLNAYTATISAWVNIPHDNVYLWTFLGYHLIQAGRPAELLALVMDLQYLATKTHARGVYYVESDLNLAAAAYPDNATLTLLQRALSQASHLLVRCKTLNQVTNTLHSRMIHNPYLASIAATAETLLPKPLLTAYHTLPDLPNPALIRTLWGHSSGVLRCALSADGTALVSVDKDSTVTLWQTESGEARFRLPPCPTEVWACDLSGDGSLLALGSNDGTVALVNSHTQTEQRRWLAHEAAIMSCALHPDGTTLVTASKDKTLKIWNTQTGQEQCCLTGHQRTVTSCDLSQNGTVVVSASNDGTVRVWNAQTGAMLNTFTMRLVTMGIDRLTFFSQQDISFTCAVSANGQIVAATSSSGMLTVWSVATGAELLNISGDKRGVYGCALSADGGKVACALSDGTLKVWDTAGGTELLSLADHARMVNSCAINSDGSLLVSASDDKTLKLWDGQNKGGATAPSIHKEAAVGCALSADGMLAVSAMDNKSLMIWDVASGAAQHTLKGHTRKINHCALSLDGKIAVSASQDQTLGVWNTQTSQLLHTLTGHSWAVNGAAISGDNGTIVSAAEDRTLKVWDAHNGSERLTLSGHSRGVSRCAISANGYTVVSASGDSTLKVWNPSSGADVATLKGHTAWVNNCAISADGSIIVSASFDKTLKVWDSRTASERLTLQGHTSTVTGCAISADGGLIVSASRDKSIKVWQTQTGTCLTTLFVDNPLLDCACSANAHIIMAVGNSGIYFLRLEL